MKILICVAGALPALLSAGADAHAGRRAKRADFEKGDSEEPLAAQRRAADAGAAIAASCSIRRRPTCGRWRRIRRAICMPAAAPAPSCIRIPPDGKGKCWPTWTRWRSTRSRSTPRPRLCRHLAGRQGLPHRGQRQAGSLLRSQGEVHLGAWRSTRRAICSWRPAIRARFIA